MGLEQTIRLIAGTFVLVSTALSHRVVRPARQLQHAPLSEVPWGAELTVDRTSTVPLAGESISTLNPPPTAGGAGAVAAPPPPHAAIAASGATHRYCRTRMLLFLPCERAGSRPGWEGESPARVFPLPGSKAGPGPRVAADTSERATSRSASTYSLISPGTHVSIWAPVCLAARHVVAGPDRRRRGASVDGTP